MKKYIINFVLLQIGWFACVAGGDFWALPATVVLLLLHKAMVSEKRSEWTFILLGGSIGVVVDTVLMHAGVLRFEGAVYVIPIWLTCLWVLFMTVIFHSLSWSRRKPLLGAAMGLLFAPVSYYSGVRLGALSFHKAALISALAIGIAWAIVMPILAWLANWLDGAEATRAPRQCHFTR